MLINFCNKIKLIFLHCFRSQITILLIFVYLFNSNFRLHSQTFTIGIGATSTSILPINSDLVYSYGKTINNQSLLTAQGLQQGMAITSISSYEQV